MATTPTTDELRIHFAAMHHRGRAFIIPNPWDVASALVLEALGFEALASTSSAMAATFGRHDQQTTLDQLEAHVRALTEHLKVPLSVDAEFGFSRDASGLVETVERLAQAGASGLSIEDYDPQEARILDTAEAVNRVEVAVETAHLHGLTLTARCESHLYGAADLDQTIDRLVRFSDVGADVVYAPGVIDHDSIQRLVEATGRPVNVLALPGCPPVNELSQLGVARVSTGGALAWSAYGTLARDGRALLDSGTYEYWRDPLSNEIRIAAFGSPDDQ